MVTHRLRNARILPALAAGAVVGATGVALAFNLPYLLETGTGGTLLVLLTFVVALVVWALGLAVIGAPLWGLAERAGLRGPHHAIALGFGTTFLAAALLLLVMDGGVVTLRDGGRTLVDQGMRTPWGLWVLVRDSGLFALLGGLVALVVWRIAYRRGAAA